VTRSSFSCSVITITSQPYQLTTAQYAPRIGTFRTEIYASVRIHDSRLYCSLFWPDQWQHASNANQTTCHTSFKPTHKEVYSFLDISHCLGAEQLTDDWDYVINLADKCQGVLQSQHTWDIATSWYIAGKHKRKTISIAEWHFRNSKTNNKHKNAIHEKCTLRYCTRICCFDTALTAAASSTVFAGADSFTWLWSIGKHNNMCLTFSLMF